MVMMRMVMLGSVITLMMKTKRPTKVYRVQDVPLTDIQWRIIRKMYTPQVQIHVLLLGGEGMVRVMVDFMTRITLGGSLPRKNPNHTTL